MSEIRYFIFDTGVTLKNPDYTKHDKEFIQYFWSLGRYNKVREGDKFIYRKPSKVSDNKQFYFFGSGTVGEIKKIGKDERGSDNVICKIINPVRFTDLIFQNDKNLLDYKWEWKIRNPEKGWGQFFNNYGMNQIPKEDFDFLCEQGLGTIIDIDENEQNKELVKSHINFIYQDHEVEDRFSKVKTRGYEQKVFSDNLRIIYDNQCCVTGLKTRSLLQGCHISSYGTDKKNRCNPNNGLCMSLIIHKCFDEGLITIDQDYKIVLSKSIKDDMLLKYLSEYDGTKIKLPLKKEFYPDKDLLMIHTKNVFKD